MRRTAAPATLCGVSAGSSAAPDRSTIGLCFSGGGFRASFFALGVVRYLAEARLLDRVVAMSSVSGGAIATAAIADKWEPFKDAGGTAEAFLERVDKPFRGRVTSENLRRRWMLGSVMAVIPGTGGRGGAYARTLGRIYDSDRVADLPVRPEFVFTSTDLVQGRAFRVAPGYIGSWDYKYIEPTPASVKLGDAVAASAAFPPSLTVVRLKTKQLPFPRPAPDQLALVDGGVYDNLGLEWFQGWGPDAERPVSAMKPAFTIVANASGPLAEKAGRFSGVTSLPRDLAIQYQQSLALRVRWYTANLLEQPGTGLYMAIASDPRSEQDVDPTVARASLPSELLGPLSLLRTDLDRFTRNETDLLSYHAYWILHARLLRYAPECALEAPSWTDYAELSPADTARLRKELELGAHRFFRRIRRRIPGWGGA